MNAETHKIPREELENGKIYAEIMNLIAETRKKDAEREAKNDERERMRAETEKVQDERERLRAEAIKLQVEAQTFKLRHLVGTVIGTVFFLAAMRAAMEWFSK